MGDLVVGVVRLGLKGEKGRWERMLVVRDCMERPTEHKKGSPSPRRGLSEAEDGAITAVNSGERGGDELVPSSRGTAGGGEGRGGAWMRFFDATSSLTLLGLIGLWSL